MLLLMFTLGSDRYALQANKVIEVIPLAKLKKIPRSPEYVSGLLNYRGLPVPVVDLTHLNHGRPSACSMSTRIILVNHVNREKETLILGLMAENVTECVKRDPQDFTGSGIRIEEAPYLGEVLNDENGMVQLMDVDHLLREDTLATFLPTRQAQKAYG